MTPIWGTNLCFCIAVEGSALSSCAALSDFLSIFVPLEGTKSIMPTVILRTDTTIGLISNSIMYLVLAGWWLAFIEPIQWTEKPANNILRVRVRNKGRKNFFNAIENTHFLFLSHFHVGDCFFYLLQLVLFHSSLLVKVALHQNLLLCRSHPCRRTYEWRWIGFSALFEVQASFRLLASQLLSRPRLRQPLRLPWPSLKGILTLDLPLLLLFIAVVTMNCELVQIRYSIWMVRPATKANLRFFLSRVKMGCQTVFLKIISLFYIFRTN